MDPSLLPRDGQNDGFDTNAAANFVTDGLAAAFHAGAKAAAAALANQLGTTTPCLVTPQPSEACLRDFIAAFGARAYRRPLLEDELERAAAFFAARQAKADSATAARLVMQAMLESPFFVYRSELGSGSDNGRTSLDSWELASQLAYLLTDRPPDAQLVAAAQTGALRDRAVVGQHASRLMSTSGAREKLGRFFYQYLRLGELDEGLHEKDASLFPSWNQSLRHAMVKETLTFVDRVVWDEGGALTDLFTAQHSYVDAQLADHYGVQLPSQRDAGGFGRAEMPAGRAGLIGHGSVLASLAHETRTSPVHRGLFVRQGLLCQKLPDPPAAAVSETAKLLGTDPNATAREAFAQFTASQKSCAACHKRFQPLGLALERFDAIGRQRDTEHGKPIDTTGKLEGTNEIDGPFADPVELMARISASDIGQSCFVSRAMTFALGRAVAAPSSGDDVDACSVTDAVKAMRDGGGTLQALFIALTQDDAFYLREPFAQ